MLGYDFRTPRLFVDAPLAVAGTIALDRMQSNYLCNVLRLPQDASVLAFNGRDGEWLCTLERGAKKVATLAVRERTRAQTQPNDVHYLFAPLKHARLDYMVEKAVELGVSRLHPVITRHTQATRVNLDRMKANAIEAAEQCGILSIPDVAERAEHADPLAALSALPKPKALAVLIGPEGGFTEAERAQLLKHPNIIRLALGPRILRADTAGVAALTLVQSVLGDWR